MQTLRRIYATSFVFSFVLALTAYVNSTFIGEHIGGQFVGILYAIAAFLTLVGLELMPRAIERIGNRVVILSIVIATILMLWVLSMEASPLMLAIAFVIFNAANTLTWYCLDIFIEHFSANKRVGAIRGAYLSLTNLAWIFAPVVAGILVSSAGGFHSLYLTVLFFTLIVAIMLFATLRSYHDGKYRKLSTLSAIKGLWGRPDLMRITGVNFILQFFYTWMVIYTPLYLYEVHHVPLETIGIMFTIMLVPFVLIEYPIGRLIDAVHHERLLLQIGILIMAASTFAFGYGLLGSSPIMLALLLFVTRVGASMVEVITESYFFKSVTDRDTEIISLFRTTRPIAYLIAPLAATVILAFYPYQILFYILTGVILIGLALLNRLSNTTS